MGLQVLTELLAPNGSPYLTQADLGAANGPASLDSSGKVAASQASARIVTVNSSKTLGLNDAGTFQRCTNTGAITVTIPANAAVAFPVGTEIEIYRSGSGTVTIAQAGSVTIECAESSYGIADQYTSVALKKLDTNVWALQGNVG